MLFPYRPSVDAMEERTALSALPATVTVPLLGADTGHITTTPTTNPLVIIADSVGALTHPGADD
jgi:hypothetical protein